MTTDEFIAARDSAGARYIAAANEFLSALVNLGGYDAALQNGVGYDYGPGVRTFFHVPQTLEQARMAHPVYIHDNSTLDLNDEIKKRRDELVAKFNR